VIALVAINGTFHSSSHRGNLLIPCGILLVALALFYKLTISIDGEVLCASLGRTYPQEGTGRRHRQMRTDPLGGTAGEFI
jgi:hypothetical protein